MFPHISTYFLYFQIFLYFIKRKYILKNIKIWHYDLFRLSNKKEIFELDFELALLDCVIVEWPEIITEYLPHKRIDIHLDEDESLLRYATVRRINKNKICEYNPKK